MSGGTILVRHNPIEEAFVEEPKVVSARGIFEIEEEGDTIIVIPAVDLRELDYQRIETGAKEILERLNGTGINNVVLDFAKTDYYGSTALGFFMKLWKRVRCGGGRMAFCNISDNEREILQITNLGKTWPILSSRSDALKAVKEKA
jgi:anti-anti-sigma factor